MKQAEDGIAELRDKVDSLVIIPNERLKLRHRSEDHLGQRLRDRRRRAAARPCSPSPT